MMPANLGDAPGGKKTGMLAIVQAAMTSCLRSPGLFGVTLGLFFLSLVVLLSSELHPFPGTPQLYEEGLLATLKLSILLTLILTRRSLDLRGGRTWPMPSPLASALELTGVMIATTVLVSAIWVSQSILVALWPAEGLENLRYGFQSLLSSLPLILVLAPWLRFLLAILPQSAAILSLLLLGATTHLLGSRGFDSSSAQVLQSLLPSIPEGLIENENLPKITLYCMSHGGMIAGLSFAIDALRRGSATPREHTVES